MTSPNEPNYNTATMSEAQLASIPSPQLSQDRVLIRVGQFLRSIIADEAEPPHARAAASAILQHQLPEFVARLTIPVEGAAA